MARKKTVVVTDTEPETIEETKVKEAVDTKEEVDTVSSTVDVLIVNLNKKNPIPKYANEGDAGVDGCANLSERKVIGPGESALIPLGIKCAIPDGYEIQVRPRSGLALKKQVTILNSPGTVTNIQ